MLPATEILWQNDKVVMGMTWNDQRWYIQKERFLRNPAFVGNTRISAFWGIWIRSFVNAPPMFLNCVWRLMIDGPPICVKQVERGCTPLGWLPKKGVLNWGPAPPKGCWRETRKRKKDKTKKRFRVPPPHGQLIWLRMSKQRALQKWRPSFWFPYDTLNGGFPFAFLSSRKGCGVYPKNKDSPHVG